MSGEWGRIWSNSTWLPRLEERKLLHDIATKLELHKTLPSKRRHQWPLLKHLAMPLLLKKPFKKPLLKTLTKPQLKTIALPSPRLQPRSPRRQQASRSKVPYSPSPTSPDFDLRKYFSSSTHAVEWNPYSIPVPSLFLCLSFLFLWAFFHFSLVRKKKINVCTNTVQGQYLYLYLPELPERNCFSISLTDTIYETISSARNMKLICSTKGDQKKNCARHLSFQEIIWDSWLS